MDPRPQEKVGRSVAPKRRDATQPVHKQTPGPTRALGVLSVPVRLALRRAEFLECGGLVLRAVVAAGTDEGLGHSVEPHMTGRDHSRLLGGLQVLPMQRNGSPNRLGPHDGHDCCVWKGSKSISTETETSSRPLGRRIDQQPEDAQPTGRVGSPRTLESLRKRDRPPSPEDSRTRAPNRTKPP